MPIRYYISLNNPSGARGSDPAFSFRAHGAEEFAAELQHALRGTEFFERWRQAQSEPDEVDPALGASDPAATVSGQQSDLQINLVVVTSLPGNLLKHRMRLLAGSAWELRDVSSA